MGAVFHRGAFYVFVGGKDLVGVVCMRAHRRVDALWGTKDPVEPGHCFVYSPLVETTKLPSDLTCLVAVHYVEDGRCLWRKAVYIFGKEGKARSPFF